MKVKVLYILNLGMMGGLVQDDESNSVSNGLYLKHVDRCDAVGLYKKTDGGLVLEKVKGDLPVKDGAPGHDRVDRQAAGQVLERAPAEPAGRERSIGVYIVMHGPANLADDPDEVAAVMNEVLPEAAKAKLHYVVMLACLIAEHTEVGTIDLDREDATYMTRFMRELNANGMRPVVAGWDVFITAAPHRPKEGEVERSVLGDDGKKIGNLAGIAGRKIVKPNRRYQTVQNEYRKLHKHLYRIVDGKLSVVLGTWSDLA